MAYGGRRQDADAMFVRTLCDRLDVPVEIHQVDVPAYRSTTGESLEEAARTLRYKIFRSVFAANCTDDLLTAHTQDDQAETVLMKLIRGAWTEGLGGIYPVFRVSSQQRILRPLLSTSRAQVVEYLQSIDQPWHGRHHKQ